MKKLFTLALVLSVTFAGYSQVKSTSYKNDTRKVATMQKASRMDQVNTNVESLPNMVRDLNGGELDYTTYDWQTNAAIINRTIVWPDGKVNFAYTWASDDSYTDRGTGIGTYDSNNDEWIPMEGRVEDEKTGFGSIARYKNNGIVVAAHTATQCGFYIIDDKDNIPVGSVPCALRLDPTVDPSWPVVMTSGPDRDIIHIIATGNADNKLYYFRSSDGQTWDCQNVVLPYLTEEYGSDWSSNVAYWMETTEENRLALVVSNAWSDCMVIYSDDNGQTWERKVFWHHPGINTTFDDWFMYPRWSSAEWGIGGDLCVAFEFNGSTGEPGSGSYYPALGGVGFWAEYLPYAGAAGVAANGYDPTNPSAPVPGNPFIMDSAYLFNDIYAAWPRWSDQTYDNPYYFGYLCPIDEYGNVQSWEEAEEFNIEDFTLHGAYNCGCASMPTLCKLPSSDYDLVVVWSAMDENSMEAETGNFYFKLFASYSGDGGHSWSPQVHLTNDFMLTYTEHVYTQAAVVGNTLVVACQADGATGTFVQSGENDAFDNLYQGYTFDLNELFPEAGVGMPEVDNNTQISLYPNPAENNLNVTLNKSAEITVYNIMGQVVMNQQGNAGVNRLDISNLNSGVYFLSAGSDTQKFVVK